MRHTRGIQVLAAAMAFSLAMMPCAMGQQPYRYAWFELPTVDPDIQFDAPVDYYLLSLPRGCHWRIIDV